MKIDEYPKCIYREGLDGEYAIVANEDDARAQRNRWNTEAKAPPPDLRPPAEVKPVDVDATKPLEIREHAPSPVQGGDEQETKPATSEGSQPNDDPDASQPLIVRDKRPYNKRK